MRLPGGGAAARRRAQPLLGADERRRLAETSGLALGAPADALAAERYLLYAALSRPQELLVLSWHATGADGAPAVRSLFIDDVCDLFDDSLLDARVRAPPREQAPGPPKRPAGDPSRPAQPQRIAALLDRDLLEQLRAHTWSASSLEVWMSCPVRWLVERQLRARELGPDAEPLARGSLAHAALRQTLERLREATGSARLTEANLELARELLDEALRDHAEEYPLSAAPERVPGLRRRLQADLERYLEHAAASAAEADESCVALEPAHLELEFGFGEDCALPALDLGEGVMMRGRIDRIDVGADHEAVVYDYKGANVSAAGKWIAGGDLQVALYMRAVEELLGWRAVGGFYQPLSGGDLRARGVLDADAGVRLSCVGGDVRAHGDVGALLEEAAAAARAAAAQAGRGELHARARTCAFRGGCMYPTICRSEC